MFLSFLGGGPFVLDRGSHLYYYGLKIIGRQETVSKLRHVLNLWGAQIKGQVTFRYTIRLIK